MVKSVEMLSAALLVVFQVNHFINSCQTLFLFELIKFRIFCWKIKLWV